MSKHTIETNRRQYNQWVATESLEDYALRYAPASFRKWSSFVIGNTALGSISFLALEAIGAALLLNYGFSNAFYGILAASCIIFLTGLPIAYYCARYNIDLDLLTRSAGFGYIGSTITSLIYASFCFIFFALEAAIMAQALWLYFGLPLSIGYFICSIIIIPLVFYGITLISKLQTWTQPLWLTLMLLPLYFVLTKQPELIQKITQFEGVISQTHRFDPYYFGIACGISLSLIAQIGEQVDYLRFMPDQSKNNRIRWWVTVILAGPGWILIGCIKQLVGMLLAGLAVFSGIAIAEAKQPIQMYNIAYHYVLDNPDTALLVSLIFVLLSQIKINVTNAYAGSLAWSNFFSRLSHSHPGRVVWLVFNTAIALVLMELGVFDALTQVLGLYSNIAIAWISVISADLLINKPFKLSPPIIEFKRAHLPNINPVGIFSMTAASIISIAAFTGLFGQYAHAYAPLVAMFISFILTPSLARLTHGKYYLARSVSHPTDSKTHENCGICTQQYTAFDMVYCPYYEHTICSLCCTLDANCHDSCKPKEKALFRTWVDQCIQKLTLNHLSPKSSGRIASFLLIWGLMISLVATVLWLLFPHSEAFTHAAITPETLFYRVFWTIALLLSLLSWWLVLVHESQHLAESELEAQNRQLANSEALFRHIIQSQPAAFFRVDAKTLRLSVIRFKLFWAIRPNIG